MDLVLDSGALSALAGRRGRERVRVLRQRGLWPPIVPSVVCAETLSGRSGPDAPVNQLLHACEVIEQLELSIARRAGALRFAAKQGSAIDAIVVAVAEQQTNPVVLTTDLRDLAALAAQARAVRVVGT